MESTEPSPTTTPSTTSERAPMKQLSSMMTGPAWIGSSTPPIPTPPEMWQFLPACARVSRPPPPAAPAPAGEVAVFPCPRPGADGDPGVDHGAAVDIGADIE